MKYDDASWHSGGDFPEDSPAEYGGTHIALVLKWCFIQGWAGELHTDDSPEEIAKVVSGEMPVMDYFYKYCDGKLTDEDFNEVGNAFVERYYGDDGLYLYDYMEHFGDLMYVAPEADHDFEKYAAMMQARYDSNVLTKADAAKAEEAAQANAVKKPWWKLW